MFTYHPERYVTRGWLRQQRQYGDGFTVHSTTKTAAIRAACPWVDHWWPGCAGGGGSAWGARKMAAHAGFGPVVLCGCPLIAGPHVGALGFASFMHREDVVANMRRGIADEPEWHAGCASMSGWTRELLGGI